MKALTAKGGHHGVPAVGKGLELCLKVDGKKMLRERGYDTYNFDSLEARSKGGVKARTTKAQLQP